jgi:hypothetical protein
VFGNKLKPVFSLFVFVEKRLLIKIGVAESDLIPVIQNIFVFLPESAGLKKSITKIFVSVLTSSKSQEVCEVALPADTEVLFALVLCLL